MLDSPRVMMVMKQPGLPLSGELSMPRAAVFHQSHGTVVYRWICVVPWPWVCHWCIDWTWFIYDWLWLMFCSTLKRCQDVCRAILTWGGISSFWRSIAESYQMLLQNWPKCVIRTEGADTCGHQKCLAYFGHVDLGGGWSAGVPPTFTIRTSGPRSSAGSCNRREKSPALTVSGTP